MAKQIINVGTAKNDGTGDSLRDGAQKINDNFSELYTALGANTGSLSIVSRLTAGDGITVSSNTGNITIRSNIATTTALGSIIVGENLTIDNDGVLSANPGGYTLPVAQAGTLGGIKVGDSLTISETGVVNVAFSQYQLPTATSQVLGGVKVGARLTITDGVLSADVQTVPVATDSVSGTVKVDNSSITINGSGVISAHYTLPTASNTVLGGVKVDGTSITIADGVISSTGGTGVVDRLTNGLNEVILGSDGFLTLPGGAKITTNGTSIDLVPGTGGYAELASNNGDSYVWVDDGGAYVVTNGSTSPYQWTFGNDGITSVQGPIRQSNSYTRTSGYGLSTPSEVVWSGSYDHISSVKLTIQVEADETGDATGWHSQACEAIIASRGYGNGTYGYGDPIMTVYGVTYTSTAPLVTFTVQRNATTRLIELVATKTAAAGSNAQLQIHSVEMGTSD